jgi:hypothetical protein
VVGVVGESARCGELLENACTAVLGILEDASQALGKGRGSGSGLARLLRRAAEALEEPVRVCLEGCWPSLSEPRCVLGEALERVKNTMQGLALRLERLGRFQVGVEEELASMLVDTLYSLLEGLCRSAQSMGRS